MSIVGPFGMCCDLFSRWTPFDDAIEREASTDDRVHVRGNGSMLLHDAVNKPVPDPRTLDQVVVQRPDPLTIAPRFEVLRARSAENRMFNGEHD